MQWSLRRSTATSTKGLAVFSAVVLLSILGVISLAGVASSLVVVARDGYRRMPKEQFARTV